MEEGSERLRNGSLFVNNTTNTSSRTEVPEEELFTVRLYSFVALGVFNILLHSIGLILLLQTLRKSKETPQHLYLINLSVTEVAKNVTIELIVVFRLLMVWWPTARETFNTLFMYTTYVSFTSMYYLYFCAMFFITTDRLLAVVCNLRYKIIWNLHRTKLLIVSAWAVALLVILPSFTAVYFLVGVRGLLEDLLLYFIPSMLNVVFLCFAVMTYFIMFRTYITSKVRIKTLRKLSNHSTTFDMFRHCKFFVSVLLITSFLVLTVIPYIIIFVCHLNKVTLPKYFYIYSNTSILFGDTLDAFIYIFTYIPVSRLLKRKTRRLKTGSSPTTSFAGLASGITFKCPSIPTSGLMESKLRKLFSSLVPVFFLIHIIILICN